ncbi:exonuclease domain-containing protein [Ideonella sp. DXS22W]|uniref:DNA-directed DNA polymerase n=1 Tax=Pseudaquabacterium inlustre TaxID=2984192 RepID=A0ABU9CLA1_9BURK
MTPGPGAIGSGSARAGKPLTREARELRVLARAAAGVLGGLALWLGTAGGLLWATLVPTERAQLVALLAPRGALLLLAALLAVVAVVSLLQRLLAAWPGAAGQLLEDSRVRLGTDTATPIPPRGAPALQALAGVIDQLVAQRSQLRADIAAQVREASRGIEQERSRLAALMSELTQAVVVCNLDGRVLLYNGSARAQFRALSAAPALADGAELIGLGRSIYTVFDRQLVAHALDKIQQQLGRGVGQPSAHFLTTTAAGQLLRVQMAPVRQVADAAQAQDGPAGLAGFVLMLANVTREFAHETERDRLLHELTEGSRAALGNLQAAAEMLAYPDLEPEQRERFLAVVQQEAQTMAARLHSVAQQQDARRAGTRWPLEDMLGADLVAAAVQRIGVLQPGLRAAPDAVDGALWLQVDSFWLLQALCYLAGRLADEYGIRLVQLRLAPAPQPGRAHLDLIWAGQAMSTETVMTWETDPMPLAGAGSGGQASQLAVREVVQRHGGEFWFERERVRHQAFFRFLLPVADAVAVAEPLAPPLDSRPEYYDFDLFRRSDDDAQARALDERRLVDLTYTVFDTETTGLNPSQGDEILQIGATRVVNGKLLRQESFEQLVDPRRPIPPEGVPIHGITPEMVAGQPDIATVLPAFHAFAADTVLVAHNAAFDMRFLQLKEGLTGLRFEQPVLDTLLLSALVHPEQDSHRLEAIAERFGITVLGRHTALGDALVTAEVFLKLVPLLAERGIHTLGQAREAAQQTWHARLKY